MVVVTKYGRSVVKYRRSVVKKRLMHTPDPTLAGLKALLGTGKG